MSYVCVSVYLCDDVRVRVYIFVCGCLSVVMRECACVYACVQEPRLYDILLGESNTETV